jgi:hypothetical protein
MDADMSEEESRNYTHVLLENLQTRLHEMGIDMKIGFERDVVQDKEMEDRLLASIKDQDTRLRVVERMCWVSLGGMGIIGGMITIYLQKILHLLAG